MPEALLVFFDGETTRADLSGWGFSSHVLEVAFVDGGNTIAGQIGIAGIKYVVYDDLPPNTERTPSLERRVAIHFTDREVVRAYTGPALLTSLHGIVLEMEDPERQSRQVVGIPWIAVKGIFEIKAWDGRVARFQESLEDVNLSRAPAGRDAVSLRDRLGRRPPT